MASLPQEDQAKLSHWLENHPYRRVLQLAAAPRPDGLNLKTNLRALSRYFNKFLAPDPLEGLTDIALHNPKAAEAATSILLHSQAITAALAATRDFDVRKFNSLLRFQEQINRKNYHEKLADYRQRVAAFRENVEK